MDKFQKTKEIIQHSLRYVKGRTVDLGAGRVKYKSLISQAASEYLAHEMEAGDQIDIVSDIYSLPLEDGNVDTVICTQVLEHVRKPWLVIAEIKRILKPNGICIATAPFIFPYHPRPDDYFRYSKEGLASLFDGFEIIESDYYGEFFSTIKEFIKMRFFDPTKNQNRGRLGNKIFHGIEEAAGFLDKFVRKDKVYANSYVIARKINQ